jgi:hypothetical protein
VNFLNGSADLRSHPNHVSPHLGILGARTISQIDSHGPGEEGSGQNDRYRKDSAEYLPRWSFRIHETAKKISQIAQAIATKRLGYTRTAGCRWGVIPSREPTNAPTRYLRRHLARTPAKPENRLRQYYIEDCSPP